MKKIILGSMILLLGSVALFGVLIITYHIIMIIGNLVYPYSPSWIYGEGAKTISLREFIAGFLTCILIPVFGILSYLIGDFIINFKKKW